MLIHFEWTKFAEPAPFPFKIGWGLAPQTTASSSFVHHQTQTTSSSSENAVVVSSSSAQRNQPSNDTREIDTCKYAEPLLLMRSRSKSPLKNNMKSLYTRLLCTPLIDGNLFSTKKNNCSRIHTSRLDIQTDIMVNIAQQYFPGTRWAIYFGIFNAFTLFGSFRLVL